MRAVNEKIREQQKAGAVVVGKQATREHVPSNLLSLPGVAYRQALGLASLSGSF